MSALQRSLLDYLQNRFSRRLELRTVERKRAGQRRYEFRGTSDPRIQPTYYVEQFVRSTWHEVFAGCGWRPSRAVVVHRSQLDEAAIKWLAQWHAMNGGK